MSITPMNRVKTVMKEITDLIKSHIHKDFTLQKSAPKWDPYGRDDMDRWSGSYSKGVKSDFIRIIATSPKKSFAFTYSNIDCDIKDVIVGVSVKENDTINLKNYSFEDFKTLLKKFRNELYELDSKCKLNTNNIYSTLEEVFIIFEVIDEEALVEELCSNIKSENKELSQKLKDLNQDASKKSKKLAGSKASVTKKLNAFCESIEYDKLKREYENALKAFNNAEKARDNKERELSSQACINELTYELKFANEKVIKAEEELNNNVDKHTKAYGQRVKDMVLKNILN